MKVSIKDFQIVKSASLEFIPGLTVIQGESNNGKTALFRAIKSCIYNEPGTNNVRLGCKNYMVGIEHKGHKIILQKGENSLYLIDGKQYNKIGKTQIPEVANALGINALSINDNTEKINFWDQMEKPFLLDRNSSELFRFIVDSGEDDNLNSTLREMVHDKNSLNTEKNLKEGSIATLKEQIDESNNLLAGSEEKIQLCENVISFGPTTSILLTLTNTITNITNTNNTIKETEEEIKRDKEIQKELTDRVNTLSYNLSVKDQLDERVIKYATLSKEITELNTQLSNKVDFKVIIESLNKIIDDKTKLADKVAKISDLMVTIKNNNVARIEYSIGQDDINRLSMLNSVIDRIKLLHNNIKSINEELLQAEKEVAPFIEEYNKIEVCPYCGNKLNGKEVTKHE